MRRRTILIIGNLVTLFCIMWPHTVRGDPPVGLHVGSGRAPDQLHFGIHVPISLTQHVRVQPNLEFGTGERLTLVALYSDLHYLFVTERVIQPYIGAGAGMTLLRRQGDLPGHTPSVNVRSSLAALFGVEIPLKDSHALMTELKVGISGVPDLTLVIGVTF